MGVLLSVAPVALLPELPREVPAGCPVGAVILFPVDFVLPATGSAADILCRGKRPSLPVPGLIAGPPGGSMEIVTAPLDGRGCTSAHPMATPKATARNNMIQVRPSSAANEVAFDSRSRSEDTQQTPGSGVQRLPFHVCWSGLRL